MNALKKIENVDVCFALRRELSEPACAASSPHFETHC
jgi:hypothetical protein